MTKEDFILLGNTYKIHGFKGEINIYNEKLITLDFSRLKYLLIDIDTILVPYFIENIKNPKKEIIRVKFENIANEEDARKLLKRSVYIPLEDLPNESSNQTVDELIIGYEVIDSKLGYLGEISYINSKTTQKLIFIYNKKSNTEFCVPWNDKFILDINHNDKNVGVKIPRDIIDLN